MKGSIVAIVTPMLKNGDIDFEAFEKLLGFHSNAGTDGIVLVGTTGESATLDFKEHESVIKKTLQIVDGRLPVVAGTGANSTSAH